MDTLGNAFLSWANDTSRTKEERFGIQLLCEALAPGPELQGGWEQRRAIKEARKYDAAFKPVLHPESLEKVAGMVGSVTTIQFDAGHGCDRPVRDVSVLRFLPALQDLTLWETEIETLEPLIHCKALRKIRMRCNGVEDYSPLAACQEIEELDIQTWHPWPEISALRLLPKLTKLQWNALGHKLQSCAVLPHLRELVVDQPGHHDELVKSVRDFHQLPEMPELLTFWGGSFFRLDGVERYPTLRTMRVIGYFKDLSPLAKLPNLTHLRVASHFIESVSPIAQAPRLFQFAIKGRRPQDFTPLMDAPVLHELYVYGCDVPQPDIDMVRLVLPSRDDHFAVSTPRQLAPLRLIINHSHQEQHKDVAWPKRTSSNFEGSEQDWGGCYFMQQSEVFWMSDMIDEALRDAGLSALPGVRRDYGRRDEKDDYHVTHSQPRMTSRDALVRLLRTEAISRLQDVIDCLRPVLARTRAKWAIRIITDPDPDAEDWDNWKRDDSPQARLDEMLADESHRQHQRDLQNRLLADEHRLKLMEEDGNDTSNFIPTPVPVPKPPETLGNVTAPPKPGADGSDGASFDPPAKDWSNDDDDDEGGIAEASPDDEDNDEHWLPPPPVLNPNIAWDKLHMYLFLTEEGLWSGFEELRHIRYLLDVKPELPPGVEEFGAHDE